ncbi:MAG: hypothetical protein EAZ85_00255 [Bacteroidetes bacterium]|nr:MAG: hypothetical protein EAZ85_00255 [Bacteroidota bacterium]TAG85878.1 MAG: hypothetical protein EAZ20_13995 [Bacteroidota bacterium]
MKKLYLLFAFFILKYCYLLAQLPNQSLTENLPQLDSTQKNNLYFSCFSKGYLRNNEYFSPVLLGETIFGYYLTPSLVYHLHQNFSIEIGANIQKDFGNTEFTQVQPRFRMRYAKTSIKDSFDVILGNIHANFAHQLIEPLYAFEQGYKRPFENGLQIKYKRKKWQTETWIDWQKQLAQNPPTQEVFWAGFKIDFNILERKNFTLALTNQNTFFHQGGQDIKATTLPPATTQLATTIGLKTSFHQKISAEIYGLYSQKEVFPDSTLISFTETSGAGIYSNIKIKTKVGDFLVNYLYTNNFRPTNMGGALYGSISAAQTGSERFFRFRELIFLRWCKDFKITENLTFSLRVEPYYDLRLKLFEYNYGFYMTFQPRFLIRKIKMVE